MTIELALKEMVPGLQKIYGDLIDSDILYGSTARGTQADDSDIDIAVLLHSGATKGMREQMLDLVVDLELACGRVLSVLCIDFDRFAEWKDTLPFYKNIRKEGIVLWQADYEDFYEATREEAAEVFAQAEQFISLVDRYLHVQKIL